MKKENIYKTKIIKKDTDFQRLKKMEQQKWIEEASQERYERRIPKENAIKAAKEKEVMELEMLEM